MGPEDRRGSRSSADDGFEDRDLLVGRPQRAEGGPGGRPEQSPAAARSSQAGAHDEGTREILQTVRAMAAKIDALLSATGPESETAQALKREMAALTRSVEDARGSLAETAELAARREEQASSEARVLSEGVAALDTRVNALDEFIRATGEQAEASALLVDVSAGQAKRAAEGVTRLKDTAEALQGSLNDHVKAVSRASKRLRWRPWLTALAFGAASFIFFVVGALLQSETDVVSFADPHRDWNELVAGHFAPMIATCVTHARKHDQKIRCRLPIYPSPGLRIPVYVDLPLAKPAPEQVSEPVVDP